MTQSQHLYPASSPTACALITGASGGIGQALVTGFKEAGYYVIGTDNTLRTVNDDCDVYIKADLAAIVQDETLANLFFDEIHEHLLEKKLTVLINNAATQILGKTETLTRQQWHQTLNVNLLAPFFLIQELLPELEAARGNVISVSSIHATQTKPEFVAYASSKAALNALTRNMAVDLGGRIRINAICPAAIATPMLLEGFIGHEDEFKQLANMHPVGRIGEAKEVVELALFLASDNARFMTGAEIALDGGIRARLHDPV